MMRDDRAKDLERFYDFMSAALKTGAIVAGVVLFGLLVAWVQT